MEQIADVCKSAVCFRFWLLIDLRILLYLELLTVFLEYDKIINRLLQDNGGE